MTGATLSGGLKFTRIANGVRATLYNLVITPSSGSPVIAINLTGALAGQNPTGIVWTNGPGTCGGASNQPAPHTAAVVAVAPLPLQASPPPVRIPSCAPR